MPFDSGRSTTTVTCHATLHLPFLEFLRSGYILITCHSFCLGVLPVLGHGPVLHFLNTMPPPAPVHHLHQTCLPDYHFLGGRFCSFLLISLFYLPFYLPVRLPVEGGHWVSITVSGGILEFCSATIRCHRYYHLPAPALLIPAVVSVLPVRYHFIPLLEPVHSLPAIPVIPTTILDTVRDYRYRCSLITIHSISRGSDAATTAILPLPFCAVTWVFTCRSALPGLQIPPPLPPGRAVRHSERSGPVLFILTITFYYHFDSTITGAG